MSLELWAIVVTISLAILGGLAALAQSIAKKFFSLFEARLDGLEAKFDKILAEITTTPFKYRQVNACDVNRANLENRLRDEFKEDIKNLEERIETKIEDLIVVVKGKI